MISSSIAANSRALLTAAVSALTPKITRVLSISSWFHSIVFFTKRTCHGSTRKPCNFPKRLILFFSRHALKNNFSRNAGADSRQQCTLLVAVVGDKCLKFFPAGARVHVPVEDNIFLDAGAVDGADFRFESWYKMRAAVIVRPVPS